MQKNENDMRIFAEHALRVFEKLIEVDRINLRTVIVNNSENFKQAAIDAALEEIMKIKRRSNKYNGYPVIFSP